MQFLRRQLGRYHDVVFSIIVSKSIALAELEVDAYTQVLGEREIRCVTIQKRIQLQVIWSLLRPGASGW